MIPRQLFEQLKPLIHSEVEAVYPGVGCCILTTRIVIEVASYFGISVSPLAVRMVVYNRACAEDPKGYGSYSLRCGFGARPGRWNGHLIAVVGNTFGDFSVQHAERLERQIITGPALVGDYYGWQGWTAVNEHGTHFEYHSTGDTSYRQKPDWKDEKRRRPIVAKVIRALKSPLANKRHLWA